MRTLHLTPRDLRVSTKPMHTSENHDGGIEVSIFSLRIWTRISVSGFVDGSDETSDENEEPISRSVLLRILVSIGDVFPFVSRVGNLLW